MSNRSLQICFAVAVVIGVVAYMLTGSSKPKSSNLNGRQILPDFEVADVARIEVGTNGLVLASSDDGWKIESMQSYPADRSKIAENVLKLKELTVGQVARGRKLGEATEVRLKSSDGNVVASLKLGDKHMAKGGYYPDGRYVDYEGNVVLVKEALDSFDDDGKRWCETKIVDTPYINFTSLADSALKEADFGFATGVVHKVTVNGNTNRVATVGAEAKGGSGRYFKLDGEKWVYIVPNYSVESLLPKKESDKDEKDKK